jgi:hypothetical protein
MARFDADLRVATAKAVSEKTGLPVDTVEAVLLFCSVIVCLMGVMYLATTSTAAAPACSSPCRSP